MGEPSANVAMRKLTISHPITQPKDVLIVGEINEKSSQ
jgi:hypothetical protein